MVQVVKSLGGEVLFSTRAESLEVQGAGVAVVLRDGKRLSADAAVLALDPPGLAALQSIEPEEVVGARISEDPALSAAFTGLTREEQAHRYAGHCRGHRPLEERARDFTR